MGSVTYARLKAVKTNSCFVSIPKIWPVSKKTPPRYFEVSCIRDESSKFVSWAGSTMEDEDSIGMNALFMMKLRLQEGQEVAVMEITGDLKQCSSAFIQPEDSDTFSNLALVQDRLSFSLLDQIRVIWKGVTFPVWIDKVTFCVHVDSVSPSGEPVLLVDRTVLQLNPSMYRRLSSPDLVDFGRSSFETTDARSRSLGEQPDASVGVLRKFFSLLWMDPNKMEPVVSTTQGNRFLSFDKITLGLCTVPLPSVSLCKESVSPCTIYVSEATLLRRGYIAKDVFLACVRKLLSPKEREEEKNNTKGPEKGNTTQVDSFVVFVVVSKRYEGDSLQLEENEVAVPCLLRRQMGLERGSRLMISSIDYVASLAATLTLFPLSQLPITVTEDKVVSAFKKWVAEVARARPFVATPGCLVHLLLEDKLKMDFVLKIDWSSKPPSPQSPQQPFVQETQNSPPFPRFCLLSNNSMSSAVVHLGKRARPVKKLWGHRLPFRCIEALDKGIDGLSLEQMGGVRQVSEKMLGDLELWLGLNVLSKQLSGVPPVSRSLLLCGRKGTGKSTLANALGCEMSRRGVHVSILNCALLKGSSTKSIKKQLKLECAECVHRQPSLLILDDVDVMAAAPTGPADEEGPLALYFSRNAQVVRRLLECALEKDVRLAAVVTSTSPKSIHPSLMISRGCHIFQDVIEMQPPDLEQRREILISVLNHKSPLSVEENPNMVQAIADSTEGYLALDLDTLVDRAKHAAWIRTVSQTSGEAKEEVLIEADFESARENFRPSSLRALQLQNFTQRTWADVGGLADVRQSLMETIIWPTKYPTLFEACPIRMQSGILLYGPPGTGKTLLAGILAVECKLNFISIKGPELLSKYTGASEQSVRDLFERAQSAKPCILFFDEFDALAPRRGHDNTGVTDRVVNQLLTQMDGVESLTGVHVLAATSRPDIIDPALLRPGRLDRCLYCPLPDQSDREEILVCLSRHLSLDPEVDLSWLASKTEHFSGADLQALLYGAQLEALHSSRRGRHRSGVTSPPEEEFICLPCDGGGQKQLARDDRQKILQQIHTVKDNVLGTVDQHRLKQRKKSSLSPSIYVSMDDLELSLTKTKPSVGPQERLRYQMLFESFSRGEVPPPSGRGERITLA